jgi:cyclase
MLSKRIIPCLDVKDGKVVKGVRFREHVILGDALELAEFYAKEGADELVFYDITASPDGRTVSRDWIYQIAEKIDIPFCVAGGIRSVEDARAILNAGADKVSVNSPALERPHLINELANAFGSQCVVVGIDSKKSDGEWIVYRNTGDVEKTIRESRRTLDWLVEVQERGAGEIVLNCMGVDGVGRGYDIEQLSAARKLTRVPLVASGGAGSSENFKEVFENARVEAALAAGVFHRKEIFIPQLKQYLRENSIEVRL